MTLQVLIVGQLDRAEASLLSDWISQSLQPAAVRSFSSLTEPLAAIEKGCWIPDLIVVLQSWPDEFSRTEIQRLNQWAPLARRVVCYGAWCESDGRTRDLWPLAVRVPMHVAAVRLQREWDLLLGKSDPVLPMSASREEIFGADHGNLRSLSGPVSIWVESPDSEYRWYLEELISKVGCVPTQGNSSMVLFDVDPWSDHRRAALQRVCEESNRRIVALANLPDPNLAAELHAMGVSEVLPKLCDQQRILDAIEMSADLAD